MAVLNASCFALIVLISVISVLHMFYANAITMQFSDNLVIEKTICILSVTILLKKLFELDLSDQFGTKILMQLKSDEQSILINSIFLVTKYFNVRNTQDS